MRQWSQASVLTVLMVFVWACDPDAQRPEASLRDLSPYPNRVKELTDFYTDQPRREKPRALQLSEDGSRLYVGLQGTEDEPGRHVVAVDTVSLEIVERYEVGSSPTALALHPSGKFLVVANRFSNYLSTIDLDTGRVTNSPIDFYTVGAEFTADGEALYLTNRWRDTLQVLDVSVSGGRLAFTKADDGLSVGMNPRDVLLDEENARAYVAAVSGLTVSVVDTKRWVEVDVDGDGSTTDFGLTSGVTRLDVGAPVNDMATHGGFLYVATLSASTHHPPDAGPDTNHDGVPGDGTANMGFQDLQNEIAVYRLETLEQVYRYTSDTICCFDYRDVSPDDPERARWLPDESTWIVEGSLPERLQVTEVTGKPVLLVVYSGSNEIQRFDIRDDGSLSAGPKVATGFNPSGLAIDAEAGRAYVSNRLSESVTVVNIPSMEVEGAVVVGDVSAGDFPATDAEIGELYYFAGADFSVDGDQTCNHCHRDRSNIGKAFMMPLLADPRGSRMTPSSRGLLETRPWFFEGAMDENNFFPVINEFARSENFCCHGRDAGCAVDPPAECQSLTPPHNHPTRDVFFLKTASELLDRERSFGDAINTRIDYLGLTRLLGLFLLHEPAMLPNPNPADTPDVQRGRQVFRSVATGCSVCHPQPGYAVSFDYNPFDALMHSGPVVTPNRHRDGTNLDLTNPGFLGTFPMAQQTDVDVHLNAPMLAGLWDRAPGFLHDGRARSLREALCTPGHPALRSGEVGHNETDGVPDTHGGTSDLSAEEIADLEAFLLSL